MTTLPKKQYCAIDLMKFVLAVLLVCAHVSAEKLTFPIYIDVWFSFYIIAVPFFFCTSTYFFIRKLEQNKENSLFIWNAYKGYTKRILKMYLAWSLIYTGFKFLAWIQTDTLSLSQVLEHIYFSIVYSSYKTIWFLPSLWVAVSLVSLFLYRWKCSIQIVLVIASVLYIVGYVGYTLPIDKHPCPILVEWYIHWFKSWRNGIFDGFVFATLGAFMAKKNIFEIFHEKRKIFFYYGMSFLFLCLFITEAFVTKKYVNSHVDANFLFMLIPFTYYFVIAVGITKLKPQPIYLHFRNLSLLLFLSQRIFITAIPDLLPVGSLELVTSNPYIGLLLFLGLTWLFSLLIVRLSEHYKLLKILW